MELYLLLKGNIIAIIIIIESFLQLILRNSKNDDEI